MKRLVVSVHDFSPMYYSELRDLLSELDSHQTSKRSILLVPNYKNSAQLHKHDGTLELIVNERDRGNELCLHGFNHIKDFMHREFKNINYEQAAWKMITAKSMMDKLGLNPVGFVPPYWKISKDAEKAVKDYGFAFLVKNRTIIDLRNNKVYSSIPIWFWPYNKSLDYAFRCFDEFLAKAWHRQSDLVRIEFHPQDLHDTKPFNYGLKLLDYLSKDRILSSNLEFLNSKKSS